MPLKISVLYIFTGANYRSVNVKKWLDWLNDFPELNSYVMLLDLPIDEKKELKLQYPTIKFLFFKPLIEIKKLSLKKRFLYIRAIAEKIGQLNVDVIHLHGAFYKYMIYPLLFLKDNPALIYNVWGSDFNLHFKKNVKSTLLLKYLFKKSDLIWTNWYQLALEIREYFPKFKEKIITIPWGVSENVFSPPNAAIIETLRQQYQLSKKDYLLLYTRGMVQNSNHDKLLQAISFLPKDLNFKLIIHGSNKNSNILQKLKQFVKKNGLENFVIFSEKYLSEEEMKALYHVADLVFSLTTREQFSQVIIEALLRDCHLILHQNSAYQFLKEVFRFNVELVDVYKPKQLAKVIEKFIREQPTPDFSYEKAVINRLFRFSKKKNEIFQTYQSVIERKLGRQLEHTS